MSVVRLDLPSQIFKELCRWLPRLDYHQEVDQFQTRRGPGKMIVEVTLQVFLVHERYDEPEDDSNRPFLLRKLSSRHGMSKGDMPAERRIRIAISWRGSNLGQSYMNMLAIGAMLLTFAAVTTYLNERFLKLPTTIASVLCSLGGSLLILLAKQVGLALPEQVEASIWAVDSGAAFMNGMLGFLLFADSLHVPLKDLQRHC